MIIVLIIVLLIIVTIIVIMRRWAQWLLGHGIRGTGVLGSGRASTPLSSVIIIVLVIAIRFIVMIINILNSSSTITVASMCTIIN